uniref:Uncharacterized protein n=1 Tax=Ciona savignyi TaxID=51511 RepID=H2ZCC7_CIOSA
MFCKLCNTGFLDRETFREHSRTCSNIGSNSSIWNSSEISTKDECVMIDVDETLDSPEVSPTADRFKDTLAIPQSSNSASLSIPPIKLGKFSNKRTLDNIFQFNVAESTSSIEKTVQSLTLKNQQKLISQDTTKHTTQAVASTVEPCSVGRRSRQKQIPHKRMIITDATPSTSKSVVAFESTKSDDETMDTSS